MITFFKYLYGKSNQIITSLNKEFNSNQKRLPKNFVKKNNFNYTSGTNNNNLKWEFNGQKDDNNYTLILGNVSQISGTDINFNKTIQSDKRSVGYFTAFFTYACNDITFSCPLIFACSRLEKGSIIAYSAFKRRSHKVKCNVVI